MQHIPFPRLAARAVLGALVPVAVAAQAGRPAVPAADAPVERIDYLTFAQGAVPVSIGGAGAALGANFERAVRVTDGDPTPFTVVERAPADAELVYQLPSPTWCGAASRRAGCRPPASASAALSPPTTTRAGDRSTGAWK